MKSFKSFLLVVLSVCFLIAACQVEKFGDRIIELEQERDFYLEIIGEGG